MYEPSNIQLSFSGFKKVKDIFEILLSFKELMRGWLIPLPPPNKGMIEIEKYENVWHFLYDIFCTI